MLMMALLQHQQRREACAQLEPDRQQMVPATLSTSLVAGRLAVAHVIAEPTLAPVRDHSLGAGTVGAVQAETLLAAARLLQDHAVQDFLVKELCLLVDMLVDCVVGCQ
jgi:hypothetical protein